MKEVSLVVSRARMEKLVSGVRAEKLAVLLAAKCACLTLCTLAASTESLLTGLLSFRKFGLLQCHAAEGERWLLTERTQVYRDIDIFTEIFDTVWRRTMKASLNEDVKTRHVSSAVLNGSR